MKNKFAIDYLKANRAPIIQWTNTEVSIDTCLPFLNYIRCDDGNEYEFISADNSDIFNAKIFDFEAIPNDDNTFILCYSATFQINNPGSKAKFFEALKKSSWTVEAVLGFLSPDKDIIEYEPISEYETKLIQSD